MITKDELIELGFKDTPFSTLSLEIKPWLDIEYIGEDLWLVADIPETQVNIGLNITNKTELQTLIKILKP